MVDATGLLSGMSYLEIRGWKKVLFCIVPLYKIESDKSESGVETIFVIL